MRDNTREKFVGASRLMRDISREKGRRVPRKGKQYIGACPYHVCVSNALQTLLPENHLKAFLQPVELSCLSREHFTNKSARTPDDEPLETLSKLLLALSMNVFRGLFL